MERNKDIYIYFRYYLDMRTFGLMTINLVSSYYSLHWRHQAVHTVHISCRFPGVQYWLFRSNDTTINKYILAKLNKNKDDQRPVEVQIKQPLYVEKHFRLFNCLNFVWHYFIMSCTCTQHVQVSHVNSMYVHSIYTAIYSTIPHVYTAPSNSQNSFIQVRSTNPNIYEKEIIE